MIRERLLSEKRNKTDLAWIMQGSKTTLKESQVEGDLNLSILNYQRERVDLGMKIVSSLMKKLTSMNSRFKELLKDLSSLNRN